MNNIHKNLSITEMESLWWELLELSAGPLTRFILDI